MKAERFFSVAVLAGLAMTGWLYLEGNAYAQNQPSASQPNNEAPQFLTNAPPPGFATRANYLNSLTKEDDIVDAYHAGKISKDEAAQALASFGDKASMDIYGKVVDQDGQPVIGAKVRGDVGQNIADFASNYTTTDGQGRFNFHGLHGNSLYLLPQKDGYEYDSRLPSQRPGDYLPDQNNPMVFTMWKRHGAEPMTRSKINSDVPCDGSIAGFNLLNGKKTPDGDLIIKLTRNPINIDRSKPFDWSVTLEITNGGLQAVTNLYPNEAPAEGYQPAITLNFPTNMAGWKSEFQRAYYFKSKGGQVYGRIAVHILADRPQPPTYFDAEIYANPAGSRNLEFDPSKRITR